MPAGASAPWPARAKLNLYLHVTGRRADGYHLLDSLVMFAEDIADAIAIAPADTFSLAVDGPYAAAVPAGPGNLAIRAARALQTATGDGRGAAIRLTKNLPAASGIGGGSADAAATLQALASHWGVTADLPAIGLGLGADVPMCLHGRAARIGGIGDIVQDAPGLPPLFAVLINPGMAVSTPAIFAARREADAEFTPPAAWPVGGFADAAGLCRWLAAQRNDLQPFAIAQAPIIADCLGLLSGAAGCLLARMSGSGATCFGLYASEAEACAALAVIRAQRPDFWTGATSLR